MFPDPCKTVNCRLDENHDSRLAGETSDGTEKAQTGPEASGGNLGIEETGGWTSPDRGYRVPIHAQKQALLA